MKIVNTLIHDIDSIKSVIRKIKYIETISIRLISNEISIFINKKPIGVNSIICTYKLVYICWNTS
jgi:hypothetical protein